MKKSFHSANPTSPSHTHCLHTNTSPHTPHTHPSTHTPHTPPPHTQPDWQPFSIQLAVLKINLRQQAASVCGIVTNAFMQTLIIALLVFNMVGRFIYIDSRSLYVCAILIRVTELVLPVWFCCSLWNYKQSVIICCMYYYMPQSVNNCIMTVLYLLLDPSLNCAWPVCVCVCAMRLCLPTGDNFFNFSL